MPDIAAGPQSLRDAAQGSGDLAGELRGIDPRPADQVKQAMPGSGAAMNAAAVGDYWDRKLGQLAEALDEREGKLVAAAGMYDSQERDATEDFAALKPGGPEEGHPREADAWT